MYPHYYSHYLGTSLKNSQRITIVNYGVVVYSPKLGVFLFEDEEFVVALPVDRFFGCPFFFGGLRMSALQFLNKKSWHTATLKNNEKVWLAEKKAEEEKKRIEELKKQLEDERHFQELRRLQVESGQLNPSVLKQQERVEWLYEWGKDKDEQEDYLLGKKSADTLLSQKGKQEEESRFQSLTQAKSSLDSSFGFSRLDMEAKLREDPLLEIKRKEIEAIQAIRSNPIKMEKLRQSLSQKQSAKSTNIKSHSDGKKRHSENHSQVDASRKDRTEKRHRSEHSRHGVRKKTIHSHRRERRHDTSTKHDNRNHSEAFDKVEEMRATYSKQGYGLVVPKGASHHGWKPNEESSAPSSSSDKSKNTKSRMNTEATNSDAVKAHRSSTSREALLEEMQRDAELLENERLARVEKYRKSENGEEEAQKAIGKNKNFLVHVANEACSRR